MIRKHKKAATMETGTRKAATAILKKETGENIVLRKVGQMVMRLLTTMMRKRPILTSLVLRRG